MPTDVFNSSGTWTAPAGIVGPVLVEAWGTGGDGANAVGAAGGGGGGGGAYASASITPATGDAYTVTIDSTGSRALDPSSIDVADAGAGSHATSSAGGNAGGVNVGSGHNGGVGETVTTSGGGGGGSATSSAVGGNGVGGIGGSGQGAGGDGGSSMAAATAGSAPGGGGGGGHTSINTAGAAGAAGRVQFTYTLGTSVDHLPWLHKKASEPAPTALSESLPFKSWISRQQSPPNIPGDPLPWLRVHGPEPKVRFIPTSATRLIQIENIPGMDVSWLRRQSPASEKVYDPPSRPFPPWLSQQLILTAVTSAQLGQYSIANTFASAQQGSYRIANAIAGYNLYVGLGAIPDLTQAPAAFSATLPFSYTLPLPGSGTRTYYILVQAQDQYGLVSQNQHYTTLTLDSSGNQITNPVNGPTDLQLYPQPGQTIRVSSQYPGYGIDQFPADVWHVWISSVTPVDTSGAPTSVVDVLGHGLTVDLATYAPGTWYVAVALFRALDSSLSTILTGSVIMPPLPSRPASVRGPAQNITPYP